MYTALRQGYNGLVSDLDIVYYANPFVYLDQLKEYAMTAGPDCLLIVYQCTRPHSLSSPPRGLHSSIFWLNLSRFCHQNYPTYPAKSAYVELKSGRV